MKEAKDKQIHGHQRIIETATERLCTKNVKETLPINKDIKRVKDEKVCN